MDRSCILSVLKDSNRPLCKDGKPVRGRWGIWLRGRECILCKPSDLSLIPQNLHSKAEKGPAGAMLWGQRQEDEWDWLAVSLAPGSMTDPVWRE